MTNDLKKAGVPVAEVIPKEGVTGWSDSWMLSNKAKHPICAYQYMNYVTTPAVQAKVADVTGYSPANTKTCEVVGPQRGLVEQADQVVRPVQRDGRAEVRAGVPTVGAPVRVGDPDRIVRHQHGTGTRFDSFPAATAHPRRTPRAMVPLAHRPRGGPRVPERTGCCGARKVGDPDYLGGHGRGPVLRTVGTCRRRGTTDARASTEGESCR
jgi:hypothetical protein